MAKDFVTITLRRETAEELSNAYIIALGGSSYQKGKGKKDGGGDAYSGPKGKPEGKSDGGGKPYGKKPKK
jgi:hypothetical protein